MMMVILSRAIVELMYYVIFMVFFVFALALSRATIKEKEETNY